MDTLVSFELTNDQEFAAALDKLGKVVSDFRVPFNLIANDFYKSNRQIFGLKSAGLYTDLQPATKAAHWKAYGSIYPIFAGAPRKGHSAGALLRSLLSKDSPYSEHIITKSMMILGTSVPYAIFHQSDRERKLLTPSQLIERKKNMSNDKYFQTAWQGGMQHLIPQRKLVFISGGPNEKAKDANVTGRLERWIKIMEKYVTKTLKEEWPA